MSEVVPERSDQEPTGVREVDEVVAAVNALENAPLSEHAGVFSAAHDSLRRALDADPEA